MNLFFHDMTAEDRFSLFRSPPTAALLENSSQLLNKNTTGKILGRRWWAIFSFSCRPHTGKNRSGKKVCISIFQQTQTVFHVVLKQNCLLTTTMMGHSVSRLPLTLHQKNSNFILLKPLWIYSSVASSTSQFLRFLCCFLIRESDE